MKKKIEKAYSFIKWKTTFFLFLSVSFSGLWCYYKPHKGWIVFQYVWASGIRCNRVRADSLLQYQISFFSLSVEDLSCSLKPRQADS